MKNGVPIISGFEQNILVSGTGTFEFCFNAVITRYSLSTACAPINNFPGGCLRMTNFSSPVLIINVGLDCPCENCCIVNSFVNDIDDTTLF